MASATLQQTPPLLPAPAEFQFGAEADAFTLDAGIPIQVGPDAGPETLFAARQVQAAVQHATGLTLALRKTADPGGGARRVALRITPRDTGAVEGDLGPEGYVLRVTADGITILASAEAGLFYGAQTLGQLLRTQGGRIPALTIRDRPVLAHRGLMLDVSRGKVPTLATLFGLIDTLASYKYNHLQLYIEHTFHFPSHPAIGAGTDPLTAEDMLALDDYCRVRHIEFVPNLQSFGHQRRLLSLPQYRHLDEVGWRWSLTPAREETYQLLDELYADFLPAFTSGWFNVDCDETWDLATGQSKTLAAEIGKGRVYLQHILRLRDLAAKRGRRIMVWADVLHHYPELVPELPDDVLLLDWQYAATDHYPTAAALGKSGRAFWVCPGTSSWSTLFPLLDNALANIRTFVRDGLDAGATGMLLTDWGDYGHYQPLYLAWYQYLFGAAIAWTGAQTTSEQFDAAFAPLLLGLPAGDATVSAMHRLARAVSAPTIGLTLRSKIALALFEDPLNGRLAEHADAPALAEVNAAADEATVVWARLPDAGLRHDFGFTARLIAFAATKGLTSQHVRATLRGLPHPAQTAVRDEGLARLNEAIVALGGARARVPALRAEFETAWLRQARRSEIQRMLQHFDVLENRYDDGLAWLDQQRSGYASGQAVDVEMTSYTSHPFAIIWEQGELELRHLAELVGTEALPADVRAWLAEAPAG